MFRFRESRARMRRVRVLNSGVVLRRCESGSINDTERAPECKATLRPQHQRSKTMAAVPRDKVCKRRRSEASGVGSGSSTPRMKRRRSAGWK
jgi:hypothetical protein